MNIFRDQKMHEKRASNLKVRNLLSEWDRNDIVFIWKNYFYIYSNPYLIILSHFFTLLHVNEQCVEQSCQNILLDLDITKCGQLVILHKQTLHRQYNGASNGLDRSQRLQCAQISTMKIEDLKSLNIAKNNPLG